MLEKNLKIKNETFGDAKTFPVIISLVNIFNERIGNYTFDYKTFKYCVTTISEFNNLNNHLNSIDKKAREYYMNLLKNDFLKRLKNSKLYEDETIYTHMCNYIVSLHRNKLKIFVNQK